MIPIDIYSKQFKRVGLSAGVMYFDITMVRQGLEKRRRISKGMGKYVFVHLIACPGQGGRAGPVPKAPPT
jgi:hypothetical protein